MARPAYRKISRESAIINRALSAADRIVDRTVKDNPLPIGETAIDPRTARRRLEMIPPDQLYEHLGGQG